ncbi:MAG: branched-chain amino acid transporter permease [Oscillospiraceae bacterium]|nr:branched-chain amino acid transporter permease [Oscillospiraceae bacterium]
MKQKKWILPVIVLLAAILLPVVFHIGLSNMSILISVLLYMYWASSWNIMGGYTGLFSLGNGIYIGLGAYLTGCLFVYANLTPYAGMLVAALLTGVFSIIIGYPTFRLQSIFYSLATFALLGMMKIIFTNFQTIFGVNVGGSNGFKFSPGNDPLNMQFSSKMPYYYIVLGMLVAVLLVSHWITRSKRGFYFRAISANEGAAASLGVSVLSLKMQAQFISAFFSAMGGGFYCMFISYVDPSKMFGVELSINVMIMCVVGGANTLWGPVIGAGLIYTINRIVTMYAPSSLNGLATLISGLILMICVFFLPGGLIPFLADEREKRAMSRRKATLQKQSGGGGGIHE